MKNSIAASRIPQKKEIIEPLETIKKNYENNYTSYIQQSQVILNAIQVEKQNVEKLRLEYFKTADELNKLHEIDLSDPNNAEQEKSIFLLIF